MNAMRTIYQIYQTEENCSDEGNGRNILRKRLNLRTEKGKRKQWNLPFGRSNINWINMNTPISFVFKSNCIHVRIFAFREGREFTVRICVYARTRETFTFAFDANGT